MRLRDSHPSLPFWLARRVPPRRPAASPGARQRTRRLSQLLTQLDGLQGGHLVRPGFWGKPTACGSVLTPTTLGVAHQASLRHAGHLQLRRPERERDRYRPGPFRKGYAWDLTKKTAKRVGFLAVGSGPIQATVTPPTSY